MFVGGVFIYFIEVDFIGGIIYLYFESGFWLLRFCSKSMDKVFFYLCGVFCIVLLEKMYRCCEIRCGINEEFFLNVLVCFGVLGFIMKFG